jgi:hypothetical protein
MPVQTPSLRPLVTQLSAQRRANPQAKAVRETVEEMLAAIGARPGLSKATVIQRLRSDALNADQKLALVKGGLSKEEEADVRSILSNGLLAGMFEGSSSNLLKALIGLEPLRADSFDAVTPPKVQKAPLAVQGEQLAAVKKMRELVQNGQLQRYYEAAIGVGDAALKDQALALFSNLPKLNGETTAEDLVAYGLWTQAPKGLQALRSTARYLPGRQLLAPTTVHSNVFDRQNFLSYLPKDQGGREAITYRATLAGEKGDNFLIKVDGKKEPIEVSKGRIYELNQPHEFKGDRYDLSMLVDYNSPFMKAKLAEAAIKTDKLVGQIDFAKAEVKGGGNVWGGGKQKTSELQRKCVQIIHDLIDMKYPKGQVHQEPGRNAGRDVGRNAIRGVGMCYEQAAVMFGLLNPFREALGVDLQFISGAVYRYVKTADQNPFGSGGHGWLQLTYRPSMEMRVCDRTWRQADHPIDLAYSKAGDRYPSGTYDRRAIMQVTDRDVNLSGKISVQTFERQFGVEGRDGRENHMEFIQ